MRHSVMGELAAIGAASGKSEEYVAGLHAARIVIQACDVQLRKKRREWRLQPDSRQYLAQGHLARSTRILSPPRSRAPGGGSCLRTMPVPAITTGKPCACASATAPRFDNPINLGMVGPEGRSGPGGAVAGGCWPVVGGCVSASATSSKTGGSTGPSIIGASSKSAIWVTGASGVLSGKSRGTSSTRNASAATSWNTGAATAPPNPPVPCVPFNVATTTMAGFVTGAKPMNEAL